MPETGDAPYMSAMGMPYMAPPMPILVSPTPGAPPVLFCLALSNQPSKEDDGHVAKKT